MCSEGNPAIIKCSSKKREEEHLTGARTLAKMTNKLWTAAKSNTNDAWLAVPASWG